MFLFCIFSFCIKHKKQKKKSKKGKHHKCASDNVVSVYHCDQFTDPVNPSTDDDVPASPEHGKISSTSQTFVDSQPDLQGKKSHKRKRKHQEDVTDSQKHFKYEKRKHDDATSLETNLQKAHHNECNSDGHSSNKKLPKQSISEQQKHKKKKMKKKKNLHASASVVNGTAHSTDYEQFHKCKKKKKKHKKTRCKEDVPQDDLSKDLPECTSSHLAVSCGSENVSMDTCEDSQALSVNELENIGPDEVKYVESVYSEHKSSKSKNKQQKLNTDIDTEIIDLDSYPDVLSEAAPDTDYETDNHVHTKKSVSEQCLNPADVLELLHADNSSYYLNSSSAVKEAGEMLEMSRCSLFSYSYCLMLTFFVVTSHNIVNLSPHSL